MRAIIRKRVRIRPAAGKFDYPAILRPPGLATGRSRQSNEKLVKWCRDNSGPGGHRNLFYTQRDILLIAVGITFHLNKHIPLTGEIMNIHNILQALIAAAMLIGVSTTCQAQSMNGQWRVESGMIYGKQVPQHILDAMQLDVTNNEFKAASGNMDSAGTLIANPQASPFQATFAIDNGDDTGRELKAIYQFEGGNLIITFGEGEHFPTGFESTEENKYLTLTYAAGTRMAGAPPAGPPPTAAIQAPPAGRDTGRGNMRDGGRGGIEKGGTEESDRRRSLGGGRRGG